MFPKIMMCGVILTAMSLVVALNFTNARIATSALEQASWFQNPSITTAQILREAGTVRVAQGPLKYQIGPGHAPRKQIGPGHQQRQQPQDPEPEPEPEPVSPTPPSDNTRSNATTYDRYSQIIRELVRSIEKGSEHARQEIGKLCRATESMNFIRSAADSGNADAQFILGRAYHLGVGVSKDYSMAKYWYTKAAEQESAAAECNLGYMYRSGKGVARDRSYGSLLVQQGRSARGYRREPNACERVQRLMGIIMAANERTSQMIGRRNFMSLFALFLTCAIFFCASANSYALPEGFVYLEDVAPGIVIDLRYAGNNNFIGLPIDGYVKPRCIVTKEMAKALKRVQSELHSHGLGLKIYDSYRPQRAVDHFVRWAKDANDTKMKDEYYPNVKKESLFNEGYIAGRSGHSRGSSVDLTIVSVNKPDSGQEIDMGSPFDFFDPKSWTKSPDVSPDQRSNRLLLKTIMEKNGFQPYEKEWWHFTLRNEPYPNRYFDFPVE